MSPSRIALVSDAWLPQTNGVANTLSQVARYLGAKGIEVLVISPDQHRTIGMPTYPEIRMAYDPWHAIDRIRAFRPEAIHIATEGPLGFWAVGSLSRQRVRFTTSFHTRYPEYLSARTPIPVSWGYSLVRWFHGRAEQTLVGTPTLLRELQQRGIGRRQVHWLRGVDTARFNPQKRREDVYRLPRPIWLYVGRVAIEKSIEDFLSLPLDGTKVVVGDGPARPELQRRFPRAIWRGYRHGEDLAAHFASADYFVFPSRTDTFGNVILEALASGLPVASVPSPGPHDLLSEGRTGAVDPDLLSACRRVVRCSGELARTSALQHSLQASHESFLSHLVPVRPGLRFSHQEAHVARRLLRAVAEGAVLRG